MNWFANFLVGFLTPKADKGISYAFGFVFFGVNFAAAGMIYLFLFETKQLSLESVDAMYSEPGMNARRSSKWVPPGYHDRKRRDSAFWDRKGSAEDIVRRNSAGVVEDGSKGSNSDEHFEKV